MPPKAKITKEMLVDAAFDVVREAGAEAVNARTVAKKLNCSTQPVMYHFPTMEALRRAVYAKADAFHTDYLMNFSGGNPMLELGRNYIRFGAEEKHLFRFLFQSNGLSGGELSRMTGAEEARPMIDLFSREAGLGTEEARAVFRVLFLTVHGYASMLANNEMGYDEAAVSADLELIFRGAVSGAKEGAC